MEGWGAFSFTNIKKKYVDYNGRPNPHPRPQPLGHLLRPPPLRQAATGVLSQLDHQPDAPHIFHDPPARPVALRRTQHLYRVHFARRGDMGEESLIIAPPTSTFPWYLFFREG